MGYFASAEEFAGELQGAWELFLASEGGRDAVLAAAAGFDSGNDLPDEPLVVVVTSDPATSTTLVLGERARAESGGADVAAQVRVTADADSLHNLLLERYDAGQIARAVEEHRLSVSGPPWSMDALIVVAGALAGFYRRSLEQRGRTHLLQTPMPEPAGVWEVDVPRPEDFMGGVVAARRRFNNATSR